MRAPGFPRGDPGGQTCSQIFFFDHTCCFLRIFSEMAGKGSSAASGRRPLTPRFCLRDFPDKAAWAPTAQPAPVEDGQGRRGARHARAALRPLSW